jgi:ATP-binding cassette, subfamily B, bacterial
MNEAYRYAQRPFALLGHYIGTRPIAHAAILIAVLGAVGCSVGAQYGVKVLVDTLSAGLYADDSVRNAWLGLTLLASLIAADNLLWRVASWIASYTFVAVTGDLRRDLFRHLTGHSPSYFAERMPGTLTSRITAVRGDDRGDRFRGDGEFAHGGGVDAARRGSGIGHVSLGCRRPAVAS